MQLIKMLEIARTTTPLALSLLKQRTMMKKRTGNGPKQFDWLRTMRLTGAKQEYCNFAPRIHSGTRPAKQC
jgi:hypothetical protein